MTKRCLHVRCQGCNQLMYIDEAEVVTCGCPERDETRDDPVIYAGPWGRADDEQVAARLVRGGGPKPYIHVHKLDSESTDSAITEMLTKKEAKL